MDTLKKSSKKVASPYEEFHKKAREAKICRVFKKIPLESLNDGQRKVIGLVTKYLETKSQLLLIVTGPGGSGKSHVIRSLQGLLSSRRVKYKVASFTGSNANAIKGETIHSLFRIGHFSNLSIVPKDSRSIAHLKSVKWFIFDEVSTVGLRMLNYISERLKSLHCSDSPYGSCCLVVVGDFSQLKPVGDYSLFKCPEPDMELQKLYANYAAFTHSVVLWEQMRVEKHEKSFKEILQRVRVGELRADDLEKLRKRDAKFLSPDEISLFAHKAIVVFPTREECQIYNDFRLSQTGNPIVTIPARYSCTAPKGIKSNISLSIGTPVVLLKNINVNAGLFNGSRGVVTEFADFDSNGEPCVIFVHFKGYSGIQFNPIRLDIPIERSDFPEKCEISGGCWIKSQFPLEVCYAVTAYKIQGMTCSKILIGTPRPGDRNTMFQRDRPSLIYVCMSRVRRLVDLAFTRGFDPELVQRSSQTDRWLAEHERLVQLEAANDANAY